MPVRLIPKNYRSLTGVLASKKNERRIGYESSLERDFAILLEFEPRVVEFEEQPLRIPYTGPDGKPRIYTPDFMIGYQPNDWEDEPIQRCLVEVKFRQELWEKWAELRPVYKAARAYSTDRGWRFRIQTEVEIRTSWFKAVKFLSAYLRVPAEPEIEAWIIQWLLQALPRVDWDYFCQAPPVF